MFDGIQFHTYSGMSLTQNNFDHALKMVEDTGEKNLMHSHATAQVKNQFMIDGSMQALFPFPIPEKDKTYFFCPQIFCLCHSLSSYYTRRKDYASYLILFTYDGEGILTYEGKTYELRAGDGFFIDCRKPHYYAAHGAFWIHSDLHFNGGISEELYQEYASGDTVCFHDKVNGRYQMLLEALVRVWDSVVRYKPLQASNHISGILTWLLLQKSAHENQSAVPDLIRGLVKYMESNYASEISLDTLAQIACMDKYHMSHLFKKYTGISPIQYLIHIRLEQARFLMVNTDLPIYRIAEETGFRDINNFTNLFKKSTGMTPKKWRSYTCSAVK